MTDLERYLYKYTDAQTRIKYLLLDLQVAIREKDDAYIPPNMAVNPKLARVQKTQVESQVERIAIDIIEHYWANIERVQNEIREYRTITDNVELMLKRADLTVREKQFIEYHYFEDKKIESCADLLGYEIAHTYRIRSAALDKLQAPYEAICGKVRQTYHEAG